MTFGTWYVRVCTGQVQLTTVEEEIENYTLDLVGIQKVTWDRVALNQQAIIQFSMERGIRIVN
jgi:hypothetical protein